ncbi:uncharacterized protein LOC135075049 [Ostrinia nubilalis]|uniref:uncharacterized protein LOC135075049 n=1 Tax=Ostrinia nubilalis TaxID=29057 RepID=UPI0030822655
MSTAAARRTMKTLIVFLLSAIDTVFVSARFPIEVYEIRETNDGNRLYINNNNEQYTPDGDTKLSRLLKPYKEDVVDKFAKNLLEKLKVLRKARQKNRIIQPDIYVLNGDLLHNSDTSSNEYNYNYNYDLDGFVDETRNQRFKADDLQNVFYQTYPEKRSKVYKPRSILRTEDRTAPPRHKYLYEKDYDE